jgi:anti-sigma B factor antagonist
LELIRIHRDRDIAVIAPAVRRLDASVAPAFKQAVVTAVEAGDTRLLLDLGGLEFMDSSGLGALVSILKAVGSRGTVSVCNAANSVLSLFKLTRMDKVFTIYGTREDALARMST